MGLYKIYDYSVYYERGSARAIPGDVEDAIERAQMIPKYMRIEILAHEDPTDPSEKGVAALRLEDARRKFIELMPSSEERMEIYTHSGDHCAWCQMVSDRSFARTVEIHFFQRVESLSSKTDRPYLDFDEVALLRSIKWYVHEGAVDRIKELEASREVFSPVTCTFTPVDWKRIVGRDSLIEWFQAGAYHPAFD